MLVIERKDNQQFRIGSDVRIKVLKSKFGSVRFAIYAPKKVPIIRDDVVSQESTEDYFFLPARLTAENGAKAAFLGAFTFPIEETDCEGIEHTRQVTVPWSSIKEIHQAVVHHFAGKR